MIVRKHWQTTEWGKHAGRDCRITRNWKGYYLFGFIPLYIDNYYVSYG